MPLSQWGDLSGAGAPNYLYGCRNNVIEGNYCYTVNSLQDGITVIDISDLSNPITVGYLSGISAMNDCRYLIKDGNYLYVTSFSTGGLVIVDVSTPSSPSVTGSISGAGAPNYLGGANSLCKSGNYVYVCAYSDNSFTVIDVSTPASPSFLANLSGAGAPNYLNGCYSCKTDGNYAYVSSRLDDAIVIIDISTPSTPTKIGHLVDGTNLNGAAGIYKESNYAYISCWTGNRITVIDVTTPSSPAYYSHLAKSGVELNRPNKLIVVCNCLYNVSYTGQTLDIIDKSDPANLTLKQSKLDTTYLNGVYGLDAKDLGTDHLIITSAFSFNGITIWKYSPSSYCLSGPFPVYGKTPEDIFKDLIYGRF